MTIDSEASYRGTRRSAQELEEAVAELLDRERMATTLPGITADGEALTRRAIRSGIESELYCRYRELAAYEADHPDVAAERLAGAGVDPGWDLIRARIGAGLRQSDLADAVGMAEADLLRLEANRYADASLDLLQRITRAIHAQIRIVHAATA